MGKATGKAHGKASRHPARSAPPRKRSAPRSRLRLGPVGLVAGIAALTLLAVYGYRFFTASPENPRTSAPPGEPAPVVKRVEPDLKPETPPLERALVDAGYERDRIGTTGGVLFVETFDPPEVVAHKLQVAEPSLRASSNGEYILVAGAGLPERLRVVALKRDTEGESFEDAGSAASPEPGQTKAVRPATRTEQAVATGAKRIVLILDDVGFENQPLEDAAGIDAALTFAVIPTAPRAERAATMLAERGFEIICHLPMEPLDYPRQSPGRDAILVSLTDEVIQERTRTLLRAVPNATGVNNHMGSRATRDRRVMKNVAEVLRQEGAFFIDSRTAGNSLAASIVGAGAVPVASRDVFLDDDPGESSVRRQLAELVRLADRKEFAVGIGHVYPTTVRVLIEEIPRLKELGYTFHFASEVVRRIDQPPTQIAEKPAPPPGVVTP
ncbi:MAG: divergent polysaccharide deacetylase family protein [Thermoanaerobaculia bacterium]